MPSKDAKGVLWCEDSFSDTMGANRLCNSHTIQVEKRNGSLYHTSIPEGVTVEFGHPNEWGIKVHGNAKHSESRSDDPQTRSPMNTFMQTKIRFQNPLPVQNRNYRVEEMPIGYKGWMVPWGVSKMKDQYWIKKSYTVKFERTGTSQLRVTRTKDGYTIQKDQFNQFQKDFNEPKEYVGSTCVGEEMGRALQAAGAYLGPDSEGFLPLSIV